MADDSDIYKLLARRCQVVRPFGEAVAVLGGCLSSLVLIGIAAAVVDVYLNLNEVHHVTAHDIFFDWRRWGIMAGSVALVACLLAWAQGTSLRRGTIDRTLEAAGSVLSPFSRYQGKEMAAGGCLVALTRFLGGNVLTSFSYFLRRPPLNHRQLVIATAIVSICRQHPEVGVDKLHDSILPGHPELTENDFEKALRVLRRHYLVDGESYLSLSPQLAAELEALA